MAKKKRVVRTVSRRRKAARLRTRPNVAEPGKTIVDQGTKRTIVGKDYTIFSRDKLNPEHKLLHAYTKVRNLTFPLDAVFADLNQRGHPLASNCQ